MDLCQQKAISCRSAVVSIVAYNHICALKQVIHSPLASFTAVANLLYLSKFIALSVECLLGA